MREFHSRNLAFTLRTRLQVAQRLYASRRTLKTWKVSPEGFYPCGFPRFGIATFQVLAGVRPYLEITSFLSTRATQYARFLGVPRVPVSTGATFGRFQARGNVVPRFRPVICSAKVSQGKLSNVRPVLRHMALRCFSPGNQEPCKRNCRVPLNG